MQQYEWHVVGVKGINDVKRELEKRNRDGWEFVQAYSQTLSGFGGGNNVLIFRRLQSS